MREIKFKYYFKHKKTEQIKCVRFKIGDIENNYQDYIFENHVLIARCLFTSLKDKANKEIYLDDIVLCFGKILGERSITQRVGVVKFGMHGFNILLIDTDGKLTYPDSINYVPEKLNIIGNIYENSELLKRSKANESIKI